MNKTFFEVVLILNTKNIYKKNKKVFFRVYSYVAIMKLLAEDETVVYSSSVIQLSKSVSRNREVSINKVC